MAPNALLSRGYDGSTGVKVVRHHLSVAMALVLTFAAAASGGLFPAADLLVQNQLPTGNWYTDEREWETGYMIPGLVRVHELSQGWGGYANEYKTSAELAGMWVLNNRPLIPGGSINPYNLLPFPNGSNPPSNVTHQLLGEEAYAFRRLSEINANPSGNIWRSEISNFYGDVSSLYPGSTAGYAAAIRAYNEVSIAADMLAHHVMAADYAGATDLATWRSELIATLAMVDNTAYFPVLALGSALWALASTTGGLDNTPVKPTAVSGDVWWDYVESEPMELVDLPWFLASHQEPTTGTFYWRFDHAVDVDTGWAYGFTEDTVFGALGLQAATVYGNGLWGTWDVEVNAAIYSVLRGFNYWENGMREHLWTAAYSGYNYMYAAEGLRLAIPEPASVLLLAGGVSALIVKGRRRRAGRASC